MADGGSEPSLYKRSRTKGEFVPRGQRKRKIVRVRKGGGGGTGDCHNGVNMALFSGWKSYFLQKSLEQNNPGCGAKKRRPQE